MSYPNMNDFIKPWDWNLPLELTVWFMVFLLVGGIWTWTRSGHWRKGLPDQLGRNVEDFAGVTQEGNGAVPVFLFLFYILIAIFMIGYPAVTLIFNYNY